MGDCIGIKQAEDRAFAMAVKKGKSPDNLKKYHCA